MILVERKFLRGKEGNLWKVPCRPQPKIADKHPQGNKKGLY